MPTIATVAENCKQAPKALLGQITGAYPDQKWTVNSEVPQEFLDRIKYHAAQYDSTETPSTSQQLPGGQLTVAESSDVILSDDGFEYGVMNALLEVQLAVSRQQGRIAGVEIINAYKGGKEETIGAYFESEMERSEQTIADINERTKAIVQSATNHQAKRGKFAGRVTKVKASIAALPAIY